MAIELQRLDKIDDSCLLKCQSTACRSLRNFFFWNITYFQVKRRGIISWTVLPCNNHHCYSLVSPSESDDSILPSVSQHVGTKRLSTSESTPFKRLPQVGDTDSEDSSSTEGDVLIRNRCNRCRRSGLYSLAFYVWLAEFMLGCLAAMMAIRVVIVGHFHQVSGFRETTCFTSGFRCTHEIHLCSCGKGCKSAYRCLPITNRVTAIRK